MGFLPPDYEQAYRSLERYGILILFGLLFVGPMIGLNFIGWIIAIFVTPFCSKPIASKSGTTFL